MSDTRRRILDASIALVGERGVRAVSFREVARRAGVSHQAPYHHFGNHLGILRAIAIEGFEGLTRTMAEAARAAGPDPHAMLTAGGVAYVTFAAAHPGHFRVMFDQSLVQSFESDGSMPEADRTFTALVEMTKLAHGAGIRTELDAETLAYLCWSTVHGLAALYIEGAFGLKTEQSADELALRVVGALGALLSPH